MAFDKARFVIHYRDGATVTEKREDSKYWDNLPKFEYACFDCGHKANEGFRLHYFCKHCDTEIGGADLICNVCEMKRKLYVQYECPECSSVDVTRECLINVIGIQPDRTIIFKEGTREPVIGKDGNRVEIGLPTQRIRGSKIYEYQFFQAKLAKMRLDRPGSTGETYGLQVGMIVDQEGHCVVMELSADYAIKMYYTTVDSLGLNFEPFEINLEECGRRIDNS